MRKTAQLKLEYINLYEDHVSLMGIMEWCDSVQSAQGSVIIQLDGLLEIKENQISNLKSQIILEQDKFGLADSQIKRERRLKFIFIGTTVLMVGFLTLSLS